MRGQRPPAVRRAQPDSSRERCLMTSPPAPACPPAFQYKATRQPMLWAAVAYSLGIIAGAYLWRPELWWLAAGVAFASASAYFALRRSGLGWLLAMGALF